MKDLKLSDVLQRQRAKYGEQAPTYQKLHLAVIEGRVPAYRLGGQWRVKSADFDQVCAGLGLPTAREEQTAA